MLLEIIEEWYEEVGLDVSIFKSEFRSSDSLSFSDQSRWWCRWISCKSRCNVGFRAEECLRAAFMLMSLFVYSKGCKGCGRGYGDISVVVIHYDVLRMNFLFLCQHDKILQLRAFSEGRMFSLESHMPGLCEKLSSSSEFRVTSHSQVISQDRNGQTNTRKNSEITWEELKNKLAYGFPRW